MITPSDVKAKVFSYLAITSQRELLPASEVNDLLLDLALDLMALEEQLVVA